ncbi:MAG: hypothetical protein ACE366_17880 [Bradymonadia bacterium]
MSQPRDLTDFGEFLRHAEREGTEYTVIGGCAVGAYARIAGEAVFSAALDLYLSQDALNELLRWAERQGAHVLKRPKPRAVPVALIDWHGLEINALTSSFGLPEPEVLTRTAREFHIQSLGLSVPIADPFDLLANKLTINRPKDQPHIEILMRFIEAEVVHDFSGEGSARHRLSSAKRLLAVTERKTLSTSLIERLLPHADTLPLFSFLAAHCETEDVGASIYARSHTVLTSEEAHHVAQLLSRRFS